MSETREERIKQIEKIASSIYMLWLSNPQISLIEIIDTLAKMGGQRNLNWASDDNIEKGLDIYLPPFKEEDIEYAEAKHPEELN